MTAYSYAYQPIVDTSRSAIVSYEALIRGPAGESAQSVLARIAAGERHRFDEQSRERAITLAASLGIDCDLNLNIMAQAMLASPRALESLLASASIMDLAPGRLVIELSERELILDPQRFAERIAPYRGCGIRVSIDDFGAGSASLNLLAQCRPDQIKLGLALIHGIEVSGPRQAIVRALVSACADLAIELVAQGVETLDEYRWLVDQGIGLFQGYLLARPAFEALGAAYLPEHVDDPLDMPGYGDLTPALLV